MDHWQENVGLPQKWVTTIIQTRDGYLWVGTKGGIARFDGVRFKVYDDLHANQLKEAEVWAIAEDDDSSIWIGTYGGGLSHLLKDGSFVTLTTKDGLPCENVTALQKSADGSLWIGTPKGLARRRDGKLAAYTTADGLPGNGVQALYLDREGVLWIGTDRGLASYASGRFTNQSAKLAGALDASVNAIAGSGREGLWIGGGGRELGGGSRDFGLSRLKDGVLTRYTTRDGLPSDSVTSIAIDLDGTVWIGTFGGLCRYRRGRFEAFQPEVSGPGDQRAFEPVSLRRIQSLFADREGSLWVGTRIDGLARLRDSTFLHLTGDAPGGAAIPLNSVFEDRHGAMWIGTPQDFRSVRDGALTTYTLPENPEANTFAEDRGGALWIGTTSGVFRLLAGKPVRVPLGPLDKLLIGILVSGARGDMWIGTRSKGLYRYSGGDVTRYLTSDGLAGDQIRGLAFDSAGGLWIATRDGGVSCLRDGHFKNYGLAEGLPCLAAQALYVDREDVVWIATHRGLCRIKRKDGATQVTVLTAENGLPNNYFYQIVEDDQANLWLTHGRGIVRISKRELNDVADKAARMVSPMLFGSESGLRSTAMSVSNQPMAWKTRAGRLWFATQRGAAIVDTSTIAHNPVAPPVHIEEVNANLRQYEHVDGLVLPPGRGDVEIRYTGLSFLAPLHVRFKYILEGFDKAWQDAGARRVAYYTNIPPGQYTFRVIGCNNDGVWNTEGASFSFRLLPRWYQTRVFLVLTGLTGVAMVVGLYRLRVRRHIRMEHELQERVTTALADIKTLHGLLPICAWCKKVRDDTGYWNQIEEYVGEHSQAEFSHGICPDCKAKYGPRSAESGHPG